MVKRFTEEVLELVKGAVTEANKKLDTAEKFKKIAKGATDMNAANAWHELDVEAHKNLSAALRKIADKIDAGQISEGKY